MRKRQGNPQPTSTAFLPRGAGIDRGVGWTYHGSATTLHGRVVAVMDDCVCQHCKDLDPFDEARRVEVKFTDGLRLLHARCDSFTPPNG